MLEVAADAAEPGEPDAVREDLLEVVEVSVGRVGHRHIGDTGALDGALEAAPGGPADVMAAID
jgi:hypothetical protein